MTDYPTTWYCNICGLSDNQLSYITEKALNSLTPVIASHIKIREMLPHIDGLVHERRNPIANALELRLSCINPSTYALNICNYDLAKSMATEGL